MNSFFLNGSTVLSFVFLLFFATGCTHEPTDPADFLYEYDQASTTLEWTAYKYTSKAGVSGTFTEIGVSGTKTASLPIEVFEDLNFIINTNSVDSRSVFRDNNLILYFFNRMIATDLIKGKASRFLGDINSGQLFIELTMNGTTIEVPFNYKLSGTEFSLEGEIDLGSWNAISALDYMENCCTSLHTGPDGIHLLWPTVKIEIKTFLNRNKS